MPHLIRHPDELQPLVGSALPVSQWISVVQSQIDQFAAATGDRQWIHCDPSRAARESPYGATIAHGFLTLSLIPALLEEVLQFPTARMMINYGLNRVRFPLAVRSGSSVRLAVQLQGVEPRGDALELVCGATIEVAGETKPACVAELVLRVYF